MSTLIQHSLTSAIKYNRRASQSIWGDQLKCYNQSTDLDELFEDYPALLSPHDSAEFVEGVREVQRALGCDVDGKLGRGTWSMILKAYEPVADTDAFWVVNDRRIKCTSDVKIVNYDQQGGLDLHRFGHFSSRKGVRPRVIVVHWGGLDPHHCYRVFSSPDRKVSSHAGIGLSKTGEPTIYQYLDLHHKSWHAGWANGFSVGIDICQQPSVKWEKKYSEPPYNVSRITNPTDRGPETILSIDPNVARAVRNAIDSLCEVLDIPKRCPRGTTGTDYEGEIYHGVLDRDYLESCYTGVVGHHHLTSSKWDCACWWDAIWS